MCPTYFGLALPLDSEEAASAPEKSSPLGQPSERTSYFACKRSSHRGEKSLPQIVAAANPT